MKTSRKVSLFLPPLQTFPDRDESAPRTLGASQVSGSSVGAEIRLRPVPCSGSCPFNSCEQLIRLSLSHPSLLHDALPTPAFLPAFSPARLNLPGEGLPLFIAFSARSHRIASAFFRALDLKKLQFWSSVVKCSSDTSIRALEKNLLQV